MQNSYYFDMVHVLAFMMMWRYFTKGGMSLLIALTVYVGGVGCGGLI